MPKKVTVMERDTRNRIILTAAQLFAGEGYDRVSIREICQNEGVAKPTLYYYFKNKEYLLQELSGYSRQMSEEIFIRFIGGREDFFDRLQGIIKARQDFAKKYPYFIHFIVMRNIMSVPENIRQELTSYPNLLSNACLIFSKKARGAAMLI